MTSLLHWLYLNVTGNLVASAITTTLGTATLFVKMHRHHKRIETHLEVKR